MSLNGRQSSPGQELPVQQPDEENKRDQGGQRNRNNDKPFGQPAEELFDGFHGQRKRDSKIENSSEFHCVSEAHF